MPADSCLGSSCWRLTHHMVLSSSALWLMSKNQLKQAPWRQGIGDRVLLMMMGIWSSHSASPDRVASMEHLNIALGRGVPNFTTGLLGGMWLDQGDYCLDLLPGLCFSLDPLDPRSSVSSCWLLCLPICSSGLSVDMRQRGSTAGSALRPSWTCSLQTRCLLSTFSLPMCVYCLLFKEFHFPSPSQNKNVIPVHVFV